KNLRNWREGVHIPQRKNFSLLGQILEIDRQEGLRAQWNALYRASRVKPVAGVAPGGGRRVPRRWAMAGAGLCVVALGAAYMLRPQAEAVDPVGSYEGIVAEYVRNVSARIGDSMIIHGARGNDCGSAPSWNEAMALLPELVTGTF